MKTMQMTDSLYRYVVDHSPEPLPILAKLRTETAAMPMAMMQISPDQGSFMHLLVKLIGARRILEVGCFTGYSALAMASALPDDGKLISLDINPDTTAVAKRYAEAAGLSKKIDIRLGPALEAIAVIKKEWGEGSVDLMFIDADKGNMLNYYEQGLPLLRKGGLILADNVLWNGTVVDQTDERPDTVAIRKFNDKIRSDERVDRVLLHISDGIYVLRKR